MLRPFRIASLGDWAGPLSLAGLLVVGGGWVWATDGCKTCVHPPRIHCPPPYCWYSEGPPCLKFKCACPRPVCEPCKLEHFGYYATCWNPWPYPQNWSHCPTPPPGVMVPPPPYPPFTPNTPRTPRPEERRPGEGDLPRPQKPENTQPTVQYYP
jgi:hypothetical protein